MYDIYGIVLGCLWIRLDFIQDIGTNYYSSSIDI